VVDFVIFLPLRRQSATQRKRPQVVYKQHIHANTHDAYETNLCDARFSAHVQFYSTA